MDFPDVAGQVVRGIDKVHAFFVLVAQQVVRQFPGHFPLLQERLDIHITAFERCASGIRERGAPGGGNRNHGGACGTGSAGLLRIMVRKQGKQFCGAFSGVRNLEQNVRLADSPVGMGVLRVIQNHDDRSVCFPGDRKAGGGADPGDNRVVSVILADRDGGFRFPGKDEPAIFRAGGNTDQRDDDGQDTA